jgi:hypothetical protein
LQRTPTGQTYAFLVQGHQLKLWAAMQVRLDAEVDDVSLVAVVGDRRPELVLSSVEPSCGKGWDPQQ